jgi:lipopolysaccharide cholinephosphotransferase
MYTINEVKKVQQRMLAMGKQIRDILERHQIPYFITYGTLLGAVRHHGFIPWDDDFDFCLFEESYDEAIEALRKELPQDDMFVEDEKSEPLYFHGWAHVKDLHSRTERGLFPSDGAYAHQGICIDLYCTKKIHEQEEVKYRLTEHLRYIERKKSKGLLPESEFIPRKQELEEKLSSELHRLASLKDLGRPMYCFFIFYDDRLFVDEAFPLKKYEFEDTYFFGPHNADALLTRCYGNYMELLPEDQRHFHFSNVTFF